MEDLEENVAKQARRDFAYKIKTPRDGLFADDENDRSDDDNDDGDGDDDDGGGGTLPQAEHHLRRSFFTAAPCLYSPPFVILLAFVYI